MKSGIRLTAKGGVVSGGSVPDERMEYHARITDAHALREAEEQDQREAEAQRDTDWRDAIVAAARTGDLERVGALLIAGEDEETFLPEAVVRDRRSRS